MAKATAAKPTPEPEVQVDTQGPATAADQVDNPEPPKMEPISMARIGLRVEKRNSWDVDVPVGTMPEQVFDEEIWSHLTVKLRAGDEIHVMPDDSAWEMVLHVQGVGRHYAHVVQKVFYKLGAVERGAALPSIYKIEYAGSTYLWRVIRGDRLLRDGFSSESLARRYAANHEAAVDR